MWAESYRCGAGQSKSRVSIWDFADRRSAVLSKAEQDPEGVEAHIGASAAGLVVGKAGQRNRKKKDRDGQLI